LSQKDDTTGETRDLDAAVKHCRTLFDEEDSPHTADLLCAALISRGKSRLNSDALPLATSDFSTVLGIVTPLLTSTTRPTTAELKGIALRRAKIYSAASALLGLSLCLQGDTKQGLQNMDAGIEILKMIMEKRSKDHDARSVLAKSLIRRGAILSSQGRYPAAVGDLSSAKKLLSDSRDKATTFDSMEYAGVLANLGAVQYQQGNLKVALEEYDAALKAAAEIRDEKSRQALLKTIEGQRQSILDAESMTSGPTAKKPRDVVMPP
jgi:tetratricopeptide (TPR) repeat protein